MAVIAADADGSVARVDFFDGPTLIGTDSTAPYSFNWNGASVGTHALAARVVDKLGAVAASAIVTITVLAPSPPPPPLPPTSTPTGTGLSASYYNNTTLTGSPALTRTEAVNFNWGSSSPATSVVSADNFSVRWTGRVTPTGTGIHHFRTYSDDGVRLWVNGVQLINNWTQHSPTYDTSASVNLTAGQAYDISLEFYSASGRAVMQLAWLPPGASSFVAIPAAQLSKPAAAPAPPATTRAGLLGSYFNNIALAGNPVLTRSEAVNFNWLTASPGPAVRSDNFSARWTGTVTPVSSGSYHFRSYSDDGVRVWVNGVLIINNWTVHAPLYDASSGISLKAGQAYAITVEFYEAGGGAVMQLAWQPPGAAGFVPVPTSALRN